MKPFSALILAASLLGNAAFAVWFVSHRAPPVSPGAPAPAAIASAPAAPPKLDASVWPRLAGEDLPAMAARLRAGGFPPALVRAIIAGQIDALFAARRKALTPTDASLPFWKNAAPNPEANRALTRLRREQENLLRSVLGEEPADDLLTRLNQTQPLDFLSAEKSADVRRIARDFDERRADLFSAGYNDVTDREKMLLLERERHDAIARSLTPAELLECDLRTSTTAQDLRDELSAFTPTEAEFRTIYQLRAAIDARFNNESWSVAWTPEQQRAHDSAMSDLTTQITSMLGETRAAEYERATDSNYRRTTQLVARLELPAETSVALWKVQQEFEQRRNALLATGRPSREQLDALYTEATNRVTPLLGSARGVEAYRQFGGNWLQSLAPRPPPTAQRH